MEISVTDAKAQLTDLVRRAEAGDEVVLTRHGRAAARIVPVEREPDSDSKRRAIARIRAEAAARCLPGPSAARGQDFLYGEDGMPA